MARPFRLHVTTLALAGALTVTGAARADEASATASPDDAAAARQLFDRGVALMTAKRDAEACPVLEQSLERYPGNGTRGKLAECYERVGRVASAWGMYREVARVAGAAGDAVRQQVAEQRAQMLAPRLAHLVVTVAGPAPQGLVVTRDGAPFPALGEPVPTDAGLVVVTASAPGRRAASARVRVVDGQVTRFEVPALEPEGAVASRPSLETTPLAPTSPAPEPARASPSTWRTPVAAGLAGAGLVSIGVGSVLALTANASYENAFDSGHCTRGSAACDAAGQRQTDGARSRADAATVLFVAGAALTAGGVVLYLTSPRARTATGRAPSLHVLGTGASLSIPL